MLNYLKGFLGLKKELSDKELLELWNKSEHTVKEYDKYMQSHLTIAEQDYLEMLNKELGEIDK